MLTSSDQISQAGSQKWLTGVDVTSVEKCLKYFGKSCDVIETSSKPAWLPSLQTIDDKKAIYDKGKFMVYESSDIIFKANNTQWNIFRMI